MTRQIIHCPHCDQSLTQVGQFWVCPRHGQVSLEKPFAPLRIFLSYGHDTNEELVVRIKADLEKRGNDVWFDKSEIKFGDDWRRSITEGIIGCHKFISFLSKHSTRDPGVCVEEIGIALGIKEGNIHTVLVESEREVKPPPGIGATQWLDMHDWKERRADGEAAWENWYREKFAELVRVVESDESRRFSGEIETLRNHLKPIKSDSRIYELLKKELTGRQWLFEAVEKWRSSDRASRVFWLVGAPGVGKSAVAANLATRGREVVAVEFCNWQQPGHKRPEQIVRTLAFQIASRLPDYRKLLLTLPDIASLDRKNSAELFDYLLADPLHHAIDGGREHHLIVIDALDEAGEAGRNPLVEMLAHHAPRLPDWIGLVVTSRPESNVIAPLQALNPFPFETSAEKNLADIRDYLRRELASKLQGRADADRLVEQILEKSEGVFLYVERFCDDIRLGHLSLDRPEQFPRGLGGVFFQYFKRQFPDLEHYEKTIAPALGAVLASREPLPVRMPQKMFGWHDTQLRKWLRTLGSIFPVTKDAGREVITPYHKSLADWMADASKAGPYFVSIAEGHQLLADELLRERRGGGESQSCLRNLPYHLVGAGRRKDAQVLLGDSAWIEKKLFALGVESVLSDVDLIAGDAAEQEDWPTGLGAAVAGALIVERAFQVPPKELIPIYARAGAGRHAVEMAQYIEDGYSRAYLLTEIADAAEASDPELARRIRRQLWSSCKCKSNTDHVIVCRLAYADPHELASFLPQCGADLHRAIVSCLLKNENTVHRLVDLPASDIASICARLVSASGSLTEHEALFIAGFDPDLQRADTRVELQAARLLLESRKLAAQQSPEQAEAIARALASVKLWPSSYIQLVVRALLRISTADTLTGARQRPDPEQRIRLLIEISLGLVNRKNYDEALAAIMEAVRVDEEEECHYFRAGGYESEVEWIAVRVVRGIAGTDPQRALALAGEGTLQRLTRTSLREVVLWELPSYEQVKETARSINLPEWRYAYTLRAAHDLAGAYTAWKEKGGDADELRTMLEHARPDEGTLILRLLRDELLPRIRPAQQPADTTALQVEVARAVASVDRLAARRMLGAITVGGMGYESRSDLVGLLPALALAGDPERALILTYQLDKDSAGYGAIAISELARLSASGLIRFKNDRKLRFEFRSALDNIGGSHLGERALSTIFARPWAWVGARVAGSIGRRLTSRPLEWQAKHTMAVVAGKASAFWPEIREELNRNWTKPEERELALCEASQWLPVDEWPMVEAIQNPALAAIAWGRMARRTPSATERDEWNRRLLQACESWPGSEDGEALDILWVFADEMGTESDPCRRLAGRILDQCHVKDQFWCAPSLLAVAGTGIFDEEQRKRVTYLASGWQDWLHTFKFSTGMPLSEAHRLAAKHLTQLADAWWPTDLTRARECIELAVGHAREMATGPRRTDVQTQCLRSWANYGEAGDWKRALAHWRWGAAFLDGADAFVASWAACGDTGYPESQKAAIEWGQRLAEALLKLR